jgi:hypothetical protein
LPAVAAFDSPAQAGPQTLDTLKTPVQAQRKEVSKKKVMEVGLRDEETGLTVNGIQRLAFATSETLSFEKFGWGDEEAKLLSQELYSAKNLKKLFLNGNKIQCDGATALAESIKNGAAPNLKVLNVAGNRGITETDKRALKDSRPGLEVSIVKYKKGADAEVYKRVDQGKLTKTYVAARAEKGEFVDGSGATCSELQGVIAVDRSALLDQQRKLSRMSGLEKMSEAGQEQMKIVADLEKQVGRLEGLQAEKRAKGCNDELARLPGIPKSTAPSRTKIVASRTSDKVNKLYETIFNTVEKAQFEQLDWGDAEARVLTEALPCAKELKKLTLNDNHITDEGAKLIAKSLKDGAAPKLKKIVLANNPGITAEAKQALMDAREGLQVL